MYAYPEVFICIWEICFWEVTEEPCCGRSRNLSYLGQPDRWYYDVREIGSSIHTDTHRHTHTHSSQHSDLWVCGVGGGISWRPILFMDNLSPKSTNWVMPIPYQIWVDDSTKELKLARQENSKWGEKSCRNSSRSPRTEPFNIISDDRDKARNIPCGCESFSYTESWVSIFFFF